MKRLAFDEGKLADSISGIRQLISLPDPVGKVTLARQLDEGLRLYRVTCPIGVIAMIFEARPDAMIQISSLAVKSGNCAILKGGKRRKKRTASFFPSSMKPPPPRIFHLKLCSKQNSTAK